MNKPDSRLTNPRTTIENVVRDNYGKMLAALIYQFKDMDLAEDSLQDAIASALLSWEKPGLPENPIAWIIKTAKHKIIDRIRRDKIFSNKQMLIAALDNEMHGEGIDGFIDEQIPDERLRLIFTCCHPAIPEAARIALTLKTLCGLSTIQIANAFLSQETTIAQRLVRAKNKIKVAGISYEVPSADQWGERLSSVMSVAYLIFNEGYCSVSAEKSVQIDLCHEGIQIAKTLMQLLPTEPEIIGLLALMYFHATRFSARLNHQGEIISLAEQDRSLWSQEYIVAGDKLLKAAMMMGNMGAYQIQAAISAVHAHTSNYEETDWAQITLLYEKLYQYKPSPVVELNAAVALSFAQGPNAGLAALESIEKEKVMQNYQPLFAAKADILNRAKKYETARMYYKKAIKLTVNQADKNWLQDQLEAISSP